MTSLPSANGKTLPITEFEPMVRKVMAAPKRSVYLDALE